MMHCPVGIFQEEFNSFLLLIQRLVLVLITRPAVVHPKEHKQKPDIGRMYKNSNKNFFYKH